MQTQLPQSASKFFWGDDLDQLNWDDHKTYIIKTLLEKGDKDAISWLFKQTDKQELFQMIDSLNLTKKSDNFWRCFLND